MRYQVPMLYHSLPTRFMDVDYPYPKIKLSNQYIYTYEWNNTLCQILLVHNVFPALLCVIIDNIGIEYKYNKQMYRVAYWNGNNDFEGKSLKCWFNKEYLKEWIEHYVISKQGVQTTLDRLYNKDRSYTTDDDRI